MERSDTVIKKRQVVMETSLFMCEVPYTWKFLLAKNFTNG